MSELLITLFPLWLFHFFLAGHHNRCHNHQGLFSGNVFKMPDQWAIVKICINKTIANKALFTITTFSGFPKYLWSRLKAFNCIAALKQKSYMCWSNRRRSSIVMPSSFTDLVESISLLFIVNLHLASLSFLFKIIAWNLFALTIVLFCLNQLTANSDTCSKLFKRPVKVLQVAGMVLSSAKLWKFF